MGGSWTPELLDPWTFGLLGQRAKMSQQGRLAKHGQFEVRSTAEIDLPFRSYGVLLTIHVQATPYSTVTT